jgi:hypothetical protein
MAAHGDMHPEGQYASDLNFMERYALDYLRRCSEREQSDIHVFGQGEIERMRRLERWALALAALSGTISGTVIAVIELWLRAVLVDDMDTAGWRELVPYWGAYLLLAGVVTGVEIVYLYWLVLRRVAWISAIAGVGLSERSPEQLLAVGLSRAALDIPNPHNRFYGIDPYARVPRWQLRLYSIAYRAKVGVTSILLRLLLRRVLVRTALRFAIPFIAIPVYAVWNALIVHWVLREARSRAAGPVAIAQLEERIESLRGRMGERERHLLVALVGEAMVATRDAHPNYLLLLTRMARALDLDVERVDVDWDACRRELAELDGPVQDLALRVLTVAVVLAGPPRRRQWKLVRDAWRACGRALDRDDLKRVYRAFIDGQGLAGVERL